MAENGGAPAPGVPYICRDIVQDILLRLPAADVHRCRYVCTEWRGLAADEYFVRTHKQCRTPMPLFFFRRDFNLGVPDPAENPSVARVDLLAVDLAARESRRVLRFPDVPDPAPAAHDLGFALGLHELDPDAVANVPNSVFRVEGSCGGILLLSYHDRLYACNPCTRHWARLPPIHLDDRIVAFYARGPPGEGREYRMLYQTGALQIQGSYWIRVLGAPEQHAVNEISGPTSPQAAGTPPALDVVLLAGLRPAHEKPPTMLHGSLHWIYVFQENNYILVFDTAVEEFRWMSPPALADADADDDHPWFDMDALQLLEMGGMLAMAIINETRTMVEVWALHDYVNQAWEYRCLIDLPRADIVANDGYDPSGEAIVYIVSQEPDVLVRCPYTLLQSDDSGDVLQYHWRPHHWTIGTPHMLEESFVLHAFLSGLGNDADDGISYGQRLQD